MMFDICKGYASGFWLMDDYWLLVNGLLRFVLKGKNTEETMALKILVLFCFPLFTHSLVGG